MTPGCLRHHCRPPMSSQASDFADCGMRNLGRAPKPPARATSVNRPLAVSMETSVRSGCDGLTAACFSCDGSHDATSALQEAKPPRVSAGSNVSFLVRPRTHAAGQLQS